MGADTTRMDITSQSADAPAIETEGLGKLYHLSWKRRTLRAVDALSLSVPAGSTFGLLGPNGAGKTTFVKCCSA